MRNKFAYYVAERGLSTEVFFRVNKAVEKVVPMGWGGGLTESKFIWISAREGVEKVEEGLVHATSLVGKDSYYKPIQCGALPQDVARQFWGYDMDAKHGKKATA